MAIHYRTRPGSTWHRNRGMILIYILGLLMKLLELSMRVDFLLFYFTLVFFIILTTIHSCCWLLFSLYTWTAILDFVLSPTISYVLPDLSLVGNLSRLCIPITTALNRLYIILGNVLPYGKLRSGEISPKDETTCEYCSDTVWTADLNIFWYASIYGRQFAAVFYHLCMWKLIWCLRESYRSKSYSRCWSYLIYVSG